MKKTVRRCVFMTITLALLCTLDAAAQGRSNEAPGRSGTVPGNSGNAPGHNKESKSGVPIDGGASILLAAGAAYGLKKMRDHRNRSKNHIV